MTNACGLHSSGAIMRSAPNLPAAIIAAVLAATSPAWADEEPTSPMPPAAGAQERPLETVVVTATRIAQPIEAATTSIDVITADDIESRRADNAIEVLRDVPGVNLVQQGSPGTSASLFIRGANAEQTLTLLDGVTVNSTTLGQFNYGTLVTDNIDRIEVLRGYGGTLYGSAAVGGVVNVLTQPGSGPPSISLRGEGGNGGTQRYVMNLGGKKGIVGVSGSVGYGSSGGFQPVNDDYTNLTSTLRVDADLVERGTLRGFFRYIDAVTGLYNNLYYLSQPDPNARFSDELYLFKGEWEHQPLDAFSYRLSGYVTHETQVYTDPDPPFPGSSIRSTTPTQINDGQAQANYYFRNIGITTAGFEFQEQLARPKYLNSAANGGTESQSFDASRSMYSGYLLQQILLLDERLIGTGGFRVDAYEGFGEEVSPSFTAGYRHDWDDTERWSTHIKGSYAEGFRAPTFNELYFPNYGNPNLDAETSSEWDGGAEQNIWGPAVTVSGTYFFRRANRLIQGVFDPATFLFQAQNVGRADVQGVETGVILAPFTVLAQAPPLTNFTLKGWYTYLDWDVVGGNGTLLRRPHNTMSAVARWQFTDAFRSDDRIDMTAAVNFVGNRADADPTTFTIATNPNYTVVDGALTYSTAVPEVSWLEQIAVYCRINNMFDRNYQQALGFQAPPINWVLGTQVTF